MLTGSYDNLSSYRLRLGGPWQVRPGAADFSGEPESMFFDDPTVLSVPECAHLQPVLYPDQPYWGAHIRGINEQDWFYRRAFKTPDVPHRRARLRFEGVDYFASVWLNGQFIGRHEGHFAPFTFDVTHVLRTYAENVLVVRVSAPWDRPNPRGSYPLDHVVRKLVKGQYEHGEGVIPPDVNPIGIWRPAWLLLDDGISLDNVSIRTQLDGAISLRLTATNTTEVTWHGTLKLDITAENHDGLGASASQMLDLPPGTHEIDHELRVPEPRLWWPWDHGRPDLYRLDACLCDESGAVGTLAETFGIRTVTLERSPKQFTYRINERAVFVRGTSYMAGLYLSQYDADTFARDIASAHDANLNLLRVHVHVAPPELYDQCDRAGMLVWQDFELNWIHDPSPQFEQRALALQSDMIALLHNHPSVVTWCCHNEPTMVFTRRQNLEQRPDPALYANAQRLDPTRPVFLCSGQLESDWRRSGDVHSYYGALWTANYTDAYRYRFRLNTEFGFEAPAAPNTLQKYPETWERLSHLDGQIEALWEYQAELIQFQVEHFRRLRPDCSAGYVHFWLADLVPQVGCGVLDSDRQPKSGYDALKIASQPLHVALEHDGRQPRALWIFNDTPRAYPGLTVSWRVRNAAGKIVLEDHIPFDVVENASQRVMQITPTNWPIALPDYARIDLALADNMGTILAKNAYKHPFQPSPRPRGYPWKFDPELSFKVFDRPGAPSLADTTSNWFFRLVPLVVREPLTEWVLRQRLPTAVLSIIARLSVPFIE